MPGGVSGGRRAQHLHGRLDAAESAAGRAGIIFVLINGDGEEEIYQPRTSGYVDATNNQMELEACVEALMSATAQHPHFDRSRYRKIVVFSDSLYVCDNVGTALAIWSRNGWAKKDGAPVDNARQWKELVRLIGKAGRAGRRVEFRWVKGKKSRRTKAVDKARQEDGQDGSRSTTEPRKGSEETHPSGPGAWQRTDGGPETDDPRHQDRIPAPP